MHESSVETSVNDDQGRVTGPLTGTVVVDLTRALAGPHAGDDAGRPGRPGHQGREPGTGDDTRGWGPPFVDAGGRRGRGSRPTSCRATATRSRSRSTSRATTAARRCSALVASADVLVENFRTGVLDRLGLRHRRLHELNPRLVVLSITGFGHDGPEGGRAGYDQIAQGEAGLMSLTGSGPDDPQRVGVPIADLLAGMYGAYGVLAALLRAGAHRPGPGRAHLAARRAVGVHAFQGTRWTVAGEVGRAQGNHHPSIAPYGLFRCERRCGADLGRQRGPLATVLRRLRARPAAPGLATNAERVANRAALSTSSRRPSRRISAADLLNGSRRPGSPPGRCARSTRSTPGTRP